MAEPVSISSTKSGFVGRFSVMASPCEILIESPQQQSNIVELQAQVSNAINAVYQEAKRIEQKFSRYLNGNITHAINNANGQAITLDDETAKLMDFAFQCYELSEGLFDISSGILRKAWTFDGSDQLPAPEAIENVLPLVGLDKVQWNSPILTLKTGMELDFGGIGKEYAVDRCLMEATQQLAKYKLTLPVLVNFGGDLACNGPRLNGKPWQVGIESVGGGEPAMLTLGKGAMATSGDARRFLLKDGIRYSHILNPKTGQSIVGAPRSVTVAANTCIEAGLISTLSLLHGDQAKSFLAEQDIPHWIQE